MREQYIEISQKTVEKALPEKLKEEIRVEFDRLLSKMLTLINYSEDVRLMNADGVRVSLGNLRSDEQAVSLFRHQLEMDAVNGVLMGTKVKPGRSAAASGANSAENSAANSAANSVENSAENSAEAASRPKPPETLFNYMRRNMRLRLTSDVLRDVTRRLEAAVLEDLGENPGSGSSRVFRSRSGRQTGVWRRECNFLVGGIVSRPGDVARTAVMATLANRLGRDTRILHACAARFQLEPVEELLDLYDSISSASQSNIPDLFKKARKEQRHFVIHVGGTNTGKTHDAMAALAKATSGVYLCPLRMLAYEGREIIRSYGVPCSFATGEEKEIDPKAKHISETIGMLDFDRSYEMAVIDECQLISGEDGSLYTNAIMGVAAKTVHVCCAYSGLEITEKLITLCNDTYTVQEHFRTSELKFESEPYRGPRKNDAYIVFSRLGAYEMAAWLQERGMRPSIVYGKLPYEVKMEEARKFESGVTDCLVATDAIAIGQNYNIQRIIFRDIVKHINRREVRLDSQTVKQVAGRAGRYGRFPVGYVNTFEAGARDEIRQKLEENDIPSATAPLELPAFLVDTDLPLSLIYKAWNEAECGEPFVKADTTVEMYICRLIESRYLNIGKKDEYSLASLPLDMKDKDQQVLLEYLLDTYNREKAGRVRREEGDWTRTQNAGAESGWQREIGRTSDDVYKSLLPDKDRIRRIVKYRPHLMTLEKICRQLDLASSFFYKIRREDLATYVIRLKPPVTKRIAEIMAENAPQEPSQSGATSQPASAAAPIDTSSWPTAYIYVSASGQTERNTGRFPYGDYSRLYSRQLEQSFGNEATYIDYYCYKRKTRTPEYCRFEPYFRYTVKLDPAYIVSDEGAYYLAEHFKVVKTDYMRAASPMHLDKPSDNSRSWHYRNNRRTHST